MLSWIASCCQGKPKKGPMGEAAGVTNCRPAMLQSRGDKTPPGVHFISFHYPQLSTSSLTEQMRQLLLMECGGLTQQTDKPLS